MSHHATIVLCIFFMQLTDSASLNDMYFLCYQTVLIFYPTGICIYFMQITYSASFNDLYFLCYQTALMLYPTGILF